jgi:hypothetical protein
MDVQIDMEAAVVLPSLWQEGLINLFIDAVPLLNNKHQIDLQERIKMLTKLTSCYNIFLELKIYLKNEYYD